MKPNIQKQRQEAEEKERSEFASRLTDALDYNNYPKHGRQSMLAEQMMVSQNTVFKWLNARYLPKKIKLEALSELLHVNIDWLSNGTGKMLGGAVEAISQGIAIIDTSEIEQWLTSPEEIEGSKSYLELPNPRKTLFAIVQQGDTMATLDGRSIPNNATVVIDTEEKTPKDKERYLIKIDKIPNAICRQANISDTGNFIFSTQNPNDHWREEYNPESFQIYGKVKYVLL